MKKTDYCKNYHLLFLAVPLGILLTHLISLMIYGVDIPYMDDWRSLLLGKAGTISFSYIFQSANDTLSVSGLFLDSLMIRYLAGNNYLYQIASLTLCLGSLFVLQLSLLKRFTENKLILSYTFLTMLFMFQAGSYWGAQSLAFHQALPLIGILLILNLHVSRRIKELKVNAVLIATLATITGLSYISGAIAILAMAVWFSILCFLSSKPDYERYLNAAIGLITGALLSLPAQLNVILVVQSGNTHRSDAPWALPSDLDFWMYLLGKISRAFGFTGSESLFLLITSLVLFLFSIFCFIYLIYNGLKNKHKIDRNSLDLLCVYGSLFISIFLYLLMVSAGRANLRAETTNSFLQIFHFGHLRFHFFWVTVLIPWMALLFGKLIYSHYSFKKFKIIISTAIIVTLFHTISTGVLFNHLSHYQRLNIIKKKGLLCLKEKSKAGLKIECQDIYPGDITEAYRLAEELNLSFTHSVSTPSE